MNRRELLQEKLAEEVDNPDVCLWMSFCDPDKPKGTQFLGVIVVMAKGPAHALVKTHALGINPGGEIMTYQTNPDDIKPADFDRLLTKDYLISVGYIDE